MDLQQLQGIGKTTAEKLQQLGIDSVANLLFRLPLRYQDKTRITPVAQLENLAYAQIEGQITGSYITQGSRQILVVSVSDQTASIQLKFFNFYYSQKLKMKTGTNIRAYGEVRLGSYGTEMIHPEFELQPQPQLPEQLTAIYPKTEGINPKTLQKAIGQAIKLMQKNAFNLTELLPQQWLQKNKLPTLQQALSTVHTPPKDADIQALLNGNHPAQQRLKLEEMLAHFLALHQIRNQNRQQNATPLPISEPQKQQFLDQLPFRLTNAQQRVINEIHHDIARNYPMQRLLQGDVGSGKTIVAALAIQAAWHNQKQAVLMAPTEILAEQHLNSLQPYFTTDQIAYLTGSIKGKPRQQILQQIKTTAKLIIGTHALFQADVEYKNLSLIIIDEQHRFGVHQRLALKQKAKTTPHNLIMTATPIPRTLAQIAYANLDISTIDELPPNRKTINTIVLSNDKMPQLAERIKTACANGEQAYWVCTLIEESENLRAKAAEHTYAELQQAFPKLNIGLIHGRLNAEQKNHIMQQFKTGKTQLLIATTVIEVGVDVPNASLMVIENAERLGLSQLHQLRGRVGRGNRQSHCVLMYQAPLSQTAQIRLQTMRNSNDGFEIARQDLQLRGPGEILGTKQKGSIEFRLSNPEQDAKLFQMAKQLAKEMLQNHPETGQKLIHRWHKNAQKLAKV